jgi:soluble lytic murein transglycosylase-like protein
MQELFDPQFNVSYGTQLLAGLIQRNGSVRDGLRAYGPRDSGYSYADIVLQIYNSH